MTGFQVMQQRGDGDFIVILKLSIAVDCEVDHREERIGIHIVVVARLLDGLVAKAQTDAETAQHLQQIVVVADQRDHLVVAFIHLLILHNSTY